MNGQIQEKMKTMYNLIDYMKKNEHWNYDMLQTCLGSLEFVYEAIFADRKKLADTIDKPMSYDEVA